MAKTNPPEVAAPEMADAPASVDVEAAFLASDAAMRNSEYPGYSAVRDLYKEYLLLNRRYGDLAGVVESLKNEVADMRRGVINV